MEAEDLVVDQGGERKVIEQVREVFPNISVTILAKALIVEAINLSDLSRFVISSEDRDALRVSNF